MNPPFSISRPVCRPSGRVSGFTLMELLVAVAIVATLAAILFPTVRGTVERGKEAACTSNLRQLGQAFQSYAADHDGTLLATSNNDTSITSGSSWSVMLLLQMGLKFPAMNQKNVLLCPAALDTYPDGQARRTYAMNYQNLPTPGSGVPASRGWEQKTKLSQHTRPSKTVLLIESRGSVADGTGAASFTLANYQQFADWRHGNCLNALFLDGHVEKFAKSETGRLEECIQNFAR